MYVYISILRGYSRNDKPISTIKRDCYLCQKIKKTIKELKDDPKDLENISELNIKQTILSRIEKLDLVAAKKDVIRFLRNPSDLDIWSHKFFTELVSENLPPRF